MKEIAYKIATKLSKKFGFHVTNTDWENEFHALNYDYNRLLTQKKFKPAKHSAIVLNALAADVHLRNRKWWLDLATGEPVERTPEVFGLKLSLAHSELSEALEGYRKDLMDDKIPTRKMVEVELADAVIRIFDLAYAYGLDIGGAYQEKQEVNASRKDHSLEERKKTHGKRF